MSEKILTTKYVVATVKDGQLMYFLKLNWFRAAIWTPNKEQASHYSSLEEVKTLMKREFNEPNFAIDTIEV